MERSEMLKQLDLMKPKLMSAVVMLLISAILLTNTTYAWFVLSTAPEVTEITTTAGSNGALEIALQSTVTSTGGTISRAEITNKIGDSSALAERSSVDANTSWGNIVDVTEGYGLEGITLYPARLNIDASNNNKINPGSYLAVPKYGSDGRVSSLTNTGKTHYVETNGVGAFENTNNYGVNVLGFTDEMGDTGTQTILSYYPRETVRREAIGKVDAYRTNLREQLITLIGANSGGIYDIIFTLTMGFKWDAQNTTTVENLVAGLAGVSTELENSLRWALLAYAVADTVNYSPDDTTEMKALGEIYKNFQSLPLSADGETQSVLSIAQANKVQKAEYQALIDAVQALQQLQSRLADANEYLEDNLPGNAGSCLIDPANTFAMKGTDPAKTSADAVIFALGIQYDMMQQPPITEDDMYMVSSDTPSGTNLFSAMATILGDYEVDLIAYMDGELNVYPESAEDRTKCILHMKVTSGVGKSAIDTFSVENNTGTLQMVYDSAQKRASGDIPMEIIRSDVTAYGYSIDLAFKSSENGSLVLQKEATSRVSGDTETEGVQGAGSTMTFEIFGDMTSDQVRKLLESVYVVFMDTDTGTIYGVARAGNIIVTLEDVTAELVMYSVDFEAMEEAADGIIRLGGAVNDNSITALTADIPCYITAIVYLNGDTVSSSHVSARGEMSLVGSVNMQFALDGSTLQPMNYTDYYTAPTESKGEGS